MGLAVLLAALVFFAGLDAGDGVAFALGYVLGSLIIPAGVAGVVAAISRRINTAALAVFLILDVLVFAAVVAAPA